ncbi:MAG: hypothetical protein KF878_12240 [Planctomycetes bacterium]|nr:hypothetical protein [Planctomycetota bacterium]
MQGLEAGAEGGRVGREAVGGAAARAVGQALDQEAKRAGSAVGLLRRVEGAAGEDLGPQGGQALGQRPDGEVARGSSSPARRRSSSRGRRGSIAR